MQKTQTMQQGFSLVELSIVLVIIGLIVSGVLVGQDLIRSAEIRATVGQIEKFNTAVNTFRGKYGKIPGDINNATAFGLVTDAEVTVNSSGDGDGNGLLSDTNGASTIVDPSGEIVNFWVHLSNANLIDGKYYGAGAPAGATLGDVGITFPQTKLGRGGIGVYQLNGFNQYHIGLANSAFGSATVTADNLTPSEAYNMDSKFDDGKPSTGQVTALGGTDLTTIYTVAAAPSTTTCAAGGDATPDSADTYNVGNTNLACQLRLRMN